MIKRAHTHIYIYTYSMIYVIHNITHKSQPITTFVVLSKLEEEENESEDRKH